MNNEQTYVTNAFGFFSTAYTNASRFARSIAFKHRATNGPRPAPATQITLAYDDDNHQFGMLKLGLSPY